MARSLFQRPLGTGFAGRYDPFEDDGDLRRRRYNVDFEQRRAAPRKSFFWRLPIIVQMIVLLIAVAAGIIVGFVAWLVIGALTMH
jgi:hypothetical protein